MPGPRRPDWAYSCPAEGRGLRAGGRSIEEALEGFREFAPGFAPGQGPPLLPTFPLNG